MRLLFSIHVEIMCDHSHSQWEGMRQYKANFIVIVIIYLCR